MAERSGVTGMWAPLVLEPNAASNHEGYFTLGSVPNVWVDYHAGAVIPAQPPRLGWWRGIVEYLRVLYR